MHIISQFTLTLPHSGWQGHRPSLGEGIAGSGLALVATPARLGGDVAFPSCPEAEGTGQCPALAMACFPINAYMANRRLPITQGAIFPKCCINRGLLLTCLSFAGELDSRGLRPCRAHRDAKRSWNAELASSQTSPCRTLHAMCDGRRPGQRGAPWPAALPLAAGSFLRAACGRAGRSFWQTRKGPLAGRKPCRARAGRAGLASYPGGRSPASGCSGSRRGRPEPCPPACARAHSRSCTACRL